MKIEILISQRHYNNFYNVCESLRYPRSVYVPGKTTGTAVRCKNKCGIKIDCDGVKFKIVSNLLPSGDRSLTIKSYMGGALLMYKDGRLNGGLLEELLFRLLEDGRL